MLVELVGLEVVLLQALVEYQILYVSLVCAHEKGHGQELTHRLLFMMLYFKAKWKRIARQLALFLVLEGIIPGIIRFHLEAVRVKCENTLVDPFFACFLCVVERVVLFA